LRDDPQEELAFDNVRITAHYMLLTEPAFGRFATKGVISSTSCGMSCMFTGLTRAAFKEALKYTRDRVQGGKPLIEHDVTKLKLSDMFLKVETARYYTRVVLRHVTERNRALTFDQSTAHALSAQVYATNIAYQATHESRQLHGANGLTKDYLIEKLYKDATDGLMEDVSNAALALEAAYSFLEEGRYTTE
jgi:alkylation response protein AidB-like acyl-CoA dehydrogenase